MIINLRGCSGAGKTTAVREVLCRLGGAIPIVNGQASYTIPLPGGRPLIVLGDYGGPRCGCDTIATQEEIRRLVRHYSCQGHVLYEGLLLSTIYAPYAALDRELKLAGLSTIWGFLDTPLDVCLARVQQRRDDAHTRRKFDPEKTRVKWERQRRLYEKCHAAGLDARWVPYGEAADQVLEWLA